MRPEVSIIIPAFNSARYIGETIRSVINQSWSEVQIVAVDDGSTDNTLEIIESFKDPRISLVKGNHLGAGAARNAGLREAKGEYIQFLDSDDVLSTDKTETQLKTLRDANSTKTIASCAWVKFENDPEEAVLRPENVWTLEDPIEWLICSLSGGGMMQTGAWLAHRDLIRAAGPWDESLSLHDDGEFFTRVLLQADRQIFVPGPQVYYRVVSGSLSRKRSRAAIESAYRVCQSRDKHLLAHRDDQKARRAIATQYAQFLYEFSFVAPDLGRAVRERMDELNAKPFNIIGGKKFRRLAALTGIKSALGARNWALSLKPGNRCRPN
jgi:glycosyltransferase involved in cell wall biosynthesis